MSREVKERTILDTFAEDFVDVVRKHAKYIIVSGFVAIAHGRSRGTEDVDIIIEKIHAKHLRIIYSDVLDENEITKIKAQIRRLRLS